MGIAYNPGIVSSGLVFAIDVANRKCISPLGCTGFNNAPQLVKNLTSQSDVINSYNGVKLGNLSYYTIFAIDYPEGSFGGSAANRDGITPGYNVTSGTKIFDFNRALNYAVYNNPTQSWVKTTVYDSYLGTAAVDTFVSEYATAVATYPDAVHIVSGSHRDSYHTSAQYAILRDLGAPSNVDSIIGFSSPEWILVGKPGLGAGNAYGWAFQNYSTNPDQVAHLNFGLPIYGGTNNYLEFDGADDFILPSSNITFGNNTTWEAWIYSTGNASTYNMFMGRYLPYFGFFGGNSLYFSNLISGSQRTIQTATNLSYNTWYYATFTTSYDGANTTMKIYTNGVETATGTWSGTQGNYSNPFMIGDGNNGSNSTWYPFVGRISNVKIYNRTLTVNEIQQNFQALRGRFGI
jgi:hypothetical protein